jgi:hypothetical protein
MQTQKDDDGTIPEFDFSKAQLARHRVRAGLETPEQYEERRALINSIIAKTGHLPSDDVRKGALYRAAYIRFKTQRAARLAEGTKRGHILESESEPPTLTREEFRYKVQRAARLAEDTKRIRILEFESESPTLTREEFDAELHAIELILESAQVALARLRRRRSEIPSVAAPSKEDA